MLQPETRRGARRATAESTGVSAGAVHLAEVVKEEALPVAAREAPVAPATQGAAGGLAIPPASINVHGAFERFDRHGLSGWITIVGAPEMKPLLDIVLDGQTIGQCRADNPREDVKRSGFGDGRCEFRFDFPPELSAEDAVRIRVRFTETDLYLGMPASPPASPPGAAREAGQQTGYASRFGGLWIDRSDWIDRLAERHRLGLVSDTLAERIYRFVRDGYLVIERAVPRVVVDRIVADLEHFWANPPPTMRMETHEPDGTLRVMQPDIAYRAGRTKLLDAFAYSAAARAAISAPPVMEFLHTIFDDKPQAFQSLTFWHGSEQPMHKDTAYVRVDGNPLALAATWLALEDIEPGTGGLQYFVGSHRAPDYRFGGISKWMNTADADYGSEHDRFLASLHEDAHKYNHTKTSFLGRKGDVLVWHADLAHGGSAVTKPDRTRLSLVTHFCPASNSPFFYRQQKLREMDTPPCKFTSQHSDIGATPAVA
ncbi:MAG: phytanoyl-CoA dioxygenase family protein [Acetobacteraceae bacterium]